MDARPINFYCIAAPIYKVQNLRRHQIPLFPIEHIANRAQLSEVLRSYPRCSHCVREKSSRQSPARDFR